ncbi:MAG: ACT domain-containing protein [Halanaerobiales bacterium]
MMIKQISIFIENKSGRLAEVTRTLGENDIDLIAISISDTTDFGILRLIVNKPDKAEEVLKDNGLTVNITEVIAISVTDKPGSLAKALTVLSNQSIGIEYMYAVGKDTNGAVVIMRVDDAAEAIEILKNENITVLNSEKVYNL